MAQVKVKIFLILICFSMSILSMDNQGECVRPEEQKEGDIIDFETIYQEVELAIEEELSSKRHLLLQIVNAQAEEFNNTKEAKKEETSLVRKYNQLKRNFEKAFLVPKNVDKSSSLPKMRPAKVVAN